MSTTGEVVSSSSAHIHTDSLHQDETNAAQAQIDRSNASSIDTMHETAICQSLHWWEPSLALLALAFFETPLDLFGPLVGGGLRH